jgi:hypothetical protein
MNRRRRRFPLFSIYGHFPKLDVAGSNPVSRSIFSISYRDCQINAFTANALIAVTRGLQSIEIEGLAPQNVSPQTLDVFRP